jgi:hypothetical protein
MCMKPLLIVFILTLMVIPCFSQETNRVVADVVMMVEGKVSTEIVKTYVDNLPFVPVISPNDIVLMTQHKVKDNVIKRLIERSSEKKPVETVKYIDSRQCFDDILLARIKYNIRKNYGRRF